jgi:aspartyl aminopeptidase
LHGQDSLPSISALLALYEPAIDRNDYASNGFPLTERFGATKNEWFDRYLEADGRITVRERRRRSAQQPYEKGAQIRRRLQELVAILIPMQEVAASFTNARIENDPVCMQVRQS